MRGFGFCKSEVDQWDTNPNYCDLMLYEQVAVST